MRVILRDIARVLIVDDSPDLCRAMAMLLNRAGHQADCAPSGPGALAYLDAAAVPDLIVLDVIMPGMDGREVLQTGACPAGDVPSPSRCTRPWTSRACGMTCWCRHGRTCPPRIPAVRWPPPAEAGARRLLATTSARPPPTADAITGIDR